MTIKIVSGGQTGADRAALDAAIELNISHGGWCPKGRLAELGQTIPLHYQLTETETREYSQRTKLNIRDSDGTLILVPSLPLDITDGTVLTLQEVREKGKPFLLIDLSNARDTAPIVDWIHHEKLHIVNVAGPRESQSPGIYQISYPFLKKLLSELLNNEYSEKPKL